MGDGQASGAAEDVRLMPDAVIGMTLEGIITSWNPAAERLYGYTEYEIVGCPSEVLLPPERLAEEADALAEIAAGDHVDHHITDRLCKNGSAVMVSLSMSPIVDSTGQIVGAATVSHRIGPDSGAGAAIEDERSAMARADRNLLDAHLQRGQRLENLQQLAGGVAHDFNNLLAVVLNYSGFVAEELDGLADTDRPQLWESLRRDVSQIQRAAEKATTLTHQLLSFSRREVVLPRPLDLNRCVTAVEDMLRRTIGEQIEVSTSLSDFLWPVMADPGQMELVLVNLAVNARDAMPDGGRLAIETTNLTVDAGGPGPLDGSAVPPGRYVRLRISDTGRGMSADLLTQIFEPFFTTKGDSGTGLGLTTVQGILQQVDGHIQISSQLGVGTGVTILLPASDRPIEPAGTTTPSAIPAAGETVLVVEDDQALREVTERILTRTGYHVVTAGTGPEAIEVARHFPAEIHLLVTDLVMPHMLGREVAEEIRHLKPGVEVLYMSGYVQPGHDMSDRVEPGATLMEKPFSEATLVAKASQVLHRP